MADEIKLTLDSKEIQKLFHELIEKTGDIGPALDDIGETLLSSVQKNFQVGGRYSVAGSIIGGSKRWKESKAARDRKGQTLVKRGYRGGLVGSMNKKRTKNKVSVGTNKPYAAIHNNGGKITQQQSVKGHKRNIKQAFGKPIKEKSIFVKAHSRKANINIAARPFLVIQREDLKEFEDVLLDYIVEK